VKIFLRLSWNIKARFITLSLLLLKRCTGTFALLFSCELSHFFDREYAEETGEVVSINSNGFEDLKYQTPAGDWLKLRELFPVEIRKRRMNL
jgi:hypothetical protein